MTARMLLKCEFDSPKLHSSDRRWQRVEIGLCGTKLTLRTNRTKTELSMQAGNVGIATDYHRRSFVLRVRVEGHQFLLAVNSLVAMVEWLDKFNEAIAISLHLETREEPRLYTTPWRRRSQSHLSINDGICCYWREKWMTRTADRRWLGNHQENMVESERRKFPSCYPLSKTHHLGSSGKFDPNTQDNLSLGATDVGNDAGKDAAIAGTHEAKAKNSKTTTLALSGKLDLKSSAAQNQRNKLLDYACRCAPVLLFHSPWRTEWYVRDGRWMNVGDQIESTKARAWI